MNMEQLFLDDVLAKRGGPPTQAPAQAATAPAPDTAAPAQGQMGQPDPALMEQALAAAEQAFNAVMSGGAAPTAPQAPPR